MTWEKASRGRYYPLAYMTHPNDGEAFIAGSSLVDFMRHLSDEFEQHAAKLAASDATDEQVAAACGAQRLAASLADSFTLFSLEPDRGCDTDGTH